VQYHHQFNLTVVTLKAVVSSILPPRHAPLNNIIFYSALLAVSTSIFPHGRAPLGILFSIRPDNHTILAKYFSIQPHGCASPGNILLITHQGFLRAVFCELPWRLFLPGSSRFPFISIGVAFLAMLCNEQPFVSFQMLTQGFRSLALVLLLLQPCGRTAFCILLMHTHIPLTPFSWGTSLELVFLYGYPRLTY
jgi:hypothetical protein